MAQYRKDTGRYLPSSSTIFEAVMLAKSDGSVDNGTSGDAFGRLRIANPHTLFDSKQLHSKHPQYWDDQEVSGANTTSVHYPNRASTIMSVADGVAGKRVRQTYQRFNYQPGKSQLVMMTGVLSTNTSANGIAACMGYFDDEDGVFLKYNNGEISLNIRSSVSGSSEDNSVPQSSWNGDKLDGSGSSGFTLDPSAAQIWWMDMEWLGVGTIRSGFVINGQFIICHSFHHANVIDSVYMSTPNLPCRYEIENDGTGPESFLEHICTTVMSEGGQQETGRIHVASTNHSAISPAQDTMTAVLGIRLDPTKLDTQIDLIDITVLNTFKDAFEWRAYLNPTVANTFSFSTHEDTSIQVAVGNDATVVTGGDDLSGGLVGGTNQGAVTSSSLKNAVRLGASIDGIPTTIVLAVSSFTGSGVFDATMSWRELT